MAARGTIGPVMGGLTDGAYTRGIPRTIPQHAGGSLDRDGSAPERITTTRKGSITSVQAIYVPADDLADPAPAGGEGVARGHDR